MGKRGRRRGTGQSRAASGARGTREPVVPTTFRFTPRRLIFFLLSPALILGGTVIASTGSVTKGAGVVVACAVVIGLNLLFGAIATEAGRLLYEAVSKFRR